MFSSFFLRSLGGELCVVRRGERRDLNMGLCVWLQMTQMIKMGRRDDERGEEYLLGEMGYCNISGKRG